MAKSDVRDYLYTMLQQYLEMQNDLKDFEEAFKAGYITEDRLDEVKADVAKLKENYDRLVYVGYLLDLPNRKHKKEKFLKANQDIENYMTIKGASKDAVYNENISIISKIKAELKALTKTK